MIINPIYTKEIRTSSRSFRTPVLLMLFNLILALVALTSMSISINQVRLSAEIRYSSFLSIFRFVASIEFILILFIMPALSSGSISAEREKKTLDLMLTTKMSPLSIVVGKLMSSLSSVMLLVLSSAPILALVFVYGGVRLPDIALLFVGYFVTAMLTGAIGLCMSSVSKRTAMSTAVTYILMIVLTIGTIALHAIVEMVTQSVGRAQFGNIGIWGRVLIGVNPLITFAAIIGSITGDLSLLNNVISIMGYNAVGMNCSTMIATGLITQCLLAIILVIIASRAVNPAKNGGKK